MNTVSIFNATGTVVQEPDTMPHSIEAEQQLLGAILTNNDVYDRVAAIIGAQHFYDPVHARIYEVAAARIAKNNLAGRPGLSGASGGIGRVLLCGARLCADDL